MVTFTYSFTTYTAGTEEATTVLRNILLYTLHVAHVSQLSIQSQST